MEGIVADTSESGNACPNALVGAWRLVSFEAEDRATGERRSPFGVHPKGRLLLLENGLMIAILTAEGRPAPGGDLERARAFNTMVAYSGRVTIEGDRLSTAVDISWNEAWVGGPQLRYFRLEGSTLELRTDWAPSPFDPNAVGRGVLRWEREE